MYLRVFACKLFVLWHPRPRVSASTSTASTSAKLGSHTTGVADSGRWSTRRIAMYALFVALAMVTSFIEFPITPVTWLKYDPSGIVCLIAGFAYGPAPPQSCLCSALCRTCSPIRGVR